MTEARDKDAGQTAAGGGHTREKGGSTRCVRTKETYKVLVAAVLTPLCQHCVCEREIMRESDSSAWHIRIYHLLKAGGAEVWTH